MAYPGKIIKNTITTASTSHVLTLPTHSNGDMILLAFELSNGTTVSSVTGTNYTWTSRQVILGGKRLGVYTTTAGATADTTVTVQTAVSSWINYYLQTLHDAAYDTSGSSTGSSISPTCPSVTTGATNCLVFNVTGSGTGEIMRHRPGMNQTCLREMASGTSFLSVSHTYEAASGATGTYQCYLGSPNVARNTARVTISFSDTGGGVMDGYIEGEPFQYLHLMTENGNTGALGDSSEYDPTNVSFENIGSLTHGSYTNSNTVLYPSIASSESALENNVYNVQLSNTNATYNDYIQLAGFPITETHGITDNYDLSGKKLIISVNTANANLHPATDIGACVGISDQTNARFWQIGTDTTPAIYSGLWPTVIDVDDATYVMDEIGTPNTASIGALIIGTEPTATFNGTYPSPVRTMSNMKVVGGSSTRPASFATAYEQAQSNILNTVVAQGGLVDGQYVVAHDMQVGGTADVYWKSVNESVKYPGAWSEADGKTNFKVGAKAFAHRVLASATTPAVEYINCTIDLQDTGTFIIDASTRNADIYDFSTLIILNGGTDAVVFSDISNMDYAGLTLSSTGRIDHNGADLSGGVTIISCTDTQPIVVTGATEAALQTALDNLANCAFQTNTVAMRIEFTGTGDVSLNMSNITWTGNTTDIHYNSTNASALTAVMQNGSNATTSAISGAATGVTISNDVTFTVNVQDSAGTGLTGAELTILSTGTQTEQYHTETMAAASEGFTFTAPLGVNVDIAVHLPGYTSYWEANRDLGSTNSSITATLTAVPAYES